MTLSFTSLTHLYSYRFKPLLIYVRNVISFIAMTNILLTRSYIYSHMHEIPNYIDMYGHQTYL